MSEEGDRDWSEEATDPGMLGQPQEARIGKQLVLP